MKSITDHSHSAECLLATVAIVVYTHCVWTVFIELAISWGVKVALLRLRWGMWEFCRGQYGDFTVYIYTVYVCFHLVLLACVHVVERPRRLVCLLVSSQSQGFSCPVVNDGTHTQCDNLQLWGCESANEIPSGHVCVCVCVHLFVNRTTWTSYKSWYRDHSVVSCCTKHHDNAADTLLS